MLICIGDVLKEYINISSILSSPFLPHFVISEVRILLGQRRLAVAVGRQPLRPAQLRSLLGSCELGHSRSCCHHIN